MEEKTRKGAKQIIFDISEELHKEIKQRALDYNIPMKKWIIYAIAEKIKREE